MSLELARAALPVNFAIGFCDETLAMDQRHFQLLGQLLKSSPQGSMKAFDNFMNAMTNSGNCEAKAGSVDVQWVGMAP
jgi:hypothetical protein